MDAQLDVLEEVDWDVLLIPITFNHVSRIRRRVSSSGDVVPNRTSQIY